MFNGIEITETRLLTNTIIMSCLLLLTIAIAVWAFNILILHNGTDKESEERINKLKNRAQTDRHAAKQLEKLNRKNKRDKKESIWINVLVWSLLLILVSLNLIFAVIPGWIDYTKKDYVVYEGEFVVHRYTQNNYIILDDGTKLYGALGLDDGTYSDITLSRTRSGAGWCRSTMEESNATRLMRARKFIMSTVKTAVSSTVV